MFGLRGGLSMMRVRRIFIFIKESLAGVVTFLSCWGSECADSGWNL